MSRVYGFFQGHLGKGKKTSIIDNAFATEKDNELAKELSVYFHTINQKACSDMDYRISIKPSIINLSRTLTHHSINLIRSLSRELNKCLVGQQSYPSLNETLIAQYITELSISSHNLPSVQRLESDWDEWFVKIELVRAIVTLHTITHLSDVHFLYGHLGPSDFGFSPDLQEILKTYG